MAWGLEEKTCIECGDKFVTDKVGTLNRDLHTKCPNCRWKDKRVLIISDGISCGEDLR